MTFSAVYLLVPAHQLKTGKAVIKLINVADLKKRFLRVARFAVLSEFIFVRILMTRLALMKVFTTIIFENILCCNLIASFVTGCTIKLTMFT